MPKVRHLYHAKWRGIRVSNLMARDGYKCSICGEELDRKVKDPHDANYITFDHIQPRSQGGRDAMSNLRLAHQICNRTRGNDPVSLEEETETFNVEI